MVVQLRRRGKVDQVVKRLRQDDLVQAGTWQRQTKRVAGVRDGLRVDGKAQQSVTQGKAFHIIQRQEKERGQSS